MYSILKVFIESFFFSARYQAYFKNILPAMESSHFPLQWSWKWQANNAHTGHTKGFPPCWYKAGHPLSWLTSARKGKRGKSFLKTRFSLHLYENNYPWKPGEAVCKSRQYKGKTMGNIFSSAVKVHKHKPFSTASSGKSGFFPGVTADNRGYTAASATWAPSPSHYCSADVRSARLQQLPPCVVIWVEKLIK